MEHFLLCPFLLTQDSATTPRPRMSPPAPAPHRLLPLPPLCLVAEAVVLDAVRVQGLPGHPEAGGGLSVDPQAPQAQPRGWRGQQRTIVTGGTRLEDILTD